MLRCLNGAATLLADEISTLQFSGINAFFANAVSRTVMRSKQYEGLQREGDCQDMEGGESVVAVFRAKYYNLINIFAIKSPCPWKPRPPA